MGIYDREYARNDQPGFRLGGDRMMVTNLVLLNVAIYVAQLLIDYRSDAQPLTNFFSLKYNLPTHPWQIYELITYGFLHSPRDILHILGNMFFLWMFGRDVEMRYGRKAFLSFYLTAIVIAGLAWLVTAHMPGARGASLVGASGGVAAVILLYVVNFPRRTVLIWAILPVPTWLFGVIWVFGDVQGALARSGNVAYSAHLAGAAYAFLYFRTRWDLSKLIPSRFSLSSLKPKPRMRIHDPDEYEEEISEEVDDILRKIKDHGQDSLTAKERKILERASRRYQQKHR